ncbi:MAG: hypothetical protein ACR2IS_00380 [Nitrososphaeraceae archaeon]
MSFLNRNYDSNGNNLSKILFNMTEKEPEQALDEAAAKSAKVLGW